MTDYTCQSQQRMLKAITAMAGRELDGITPKEMAEKTGMKPAQITSTLANLQIAGWATKTETGRWRLTPLPVQVFGKVAQNFEQARLKILNMEQNYLFNQ